LISSILSNEVQSFIQKHQHDDTHQLLLKYKTVNNVPISSIVDQIIGRKKASEKLPSWYHHPDTIYPPSLNIEQTSSEQAATFKINILDQELGGTLRDKTIVDLTGGFGVDSFKFSQAFKHVHLVEPDINLLEVTKHNLGNFGVTNISYHNATAEQFLYSLTEDTQVDVIYIDPSRRTNENKKVLSLKDCEPDVVKLQEKMGQITDRWLVKCSPLLDIDTGLKQLSYEKKVFVLSILNECKELLFYCDKNTNFRTFIEAIDLKRNTEQTFSFSLSDERTAEVRYAEPLKYLYEPNVAILKAGAFKMIASVFDVYKLHPNTHLYTSDNLISSFPGRIFELVTIAKSDRKEIALFFPERKANVITRNYPLSVEALRNKIGLKDGGDRYLIGCSGIKKKFLLVANRLDRL
jgi:hypothetical protein